jgi:cohesin loading factor subunit SCC2
MKTCVFCSKIHRYSPTEAAKVFDKPLNRKNNLQFTPQHTLNQLKAAFDQEPDEEEKRQKLVEEYLDVSIQLYLNLVTE